MTGWVILTAYGPAVMPALPPPNGVDRALAEMYPDNVTPLRRAE